MDRGCVKTGRETSRACCSVRHCATSGAALAVAYEQSGDLQREGIESEIFESPPGGANIYARLKGNGPEEGHPADGSHGRRGGGPRYWTVDPVTLAAKTL